MAFGNIDAGYVGNVSEQTFKEVIAQRDDLTVIDGGRMIPPSAETVYYPGQLMAQYTSGANSGLFVPYDSANASATDGSQKPVGVLYGGASVMPNGYGSEVRVITRGCVFSDLIVTNASGVQAAGISDALVTALGGKRKVVHGQNCLVF